jgi:putative membrane protein
VTAECDKATPAAELRLNYLAYERTALANERTLLAYARTALAVAVVGGTLIKLFTSTPTTVGGWVLIGSAAAILLLGVGRFVRLGRRLRTRGHLSPASQTNRKGALSP